MSTKLTTAPCALIMAGGTGGHIFPGLALARALREQGWRVHWLGVAANMEGRLVPLEGFAFESIDFGGVRGKGVLAKLALPWRLAKACVQSWRVLARVQPSVVVGFGGYVTFPAGMVAALTGRPLMLHEQNSVPGMANRVLAKVAKRVLSAYPTQGAQALPKAEWIGNPLRQEFVSQPEPAQRFAGRSGPLRLLVLGGSLGAKALNDVVPAAVAQLPVEKRPIIIHQGGAQHLAALEAAYAQAGVQATLTPFIDQPAQAMADADWIICRAGASTVTELAAVGAAALLVPFPFAVDDHQTRNAQFLVDAKAGQLMQQRDLTADVLANLMSKLNRADLLAQAQQAKTMQKTQAVAQMVQYCNQLAAESQAS